MPQLKGKEEDRVLFWHYPHYGNQGGEPSSIVRRGDYKLIRYYEDGREELYNLKEDLAESTDLAPKHPEVVASLRALLDAHLTEVKAKIPQPDPRFDAVKKKKQLRETHSKGKARLETRHAGYLDPDYKPNKDWWGSKVTQD